MSEPTIDEMLAIVDSAIFNCTPDDAPRIREAIRAILEQHQMWLKVDEVKDERILQLEAELDGLERESTKNERAAIRAFVERVEKRLPEYNTGKGADSWLREYRQAVHAELAAMEKEAE